MYNVRSEVISFPVFIEVVNFDPRAVPAIREVVESIIGEKLGGLTTFIFRLDGSDSSRAGVRLGLKLRPSVKP